MNRLSLSIVINTAIFIFGWITIIFFLTSLDRDSISNDFQKWRNAVEVIAPQLIVDGNLVQLESLIQTEHNIAARICNLDGQIILENFEKGLTSTCQNLAGSADTTPLIHDSRQVGSLVSRAPSVLKKFREKYILIFLIALLSFILFIGYLKKIAHTRLTKALLEYISGVERDSDKLRNFSVNDAMSSLVEAIIGYENTQKKLILLEIAHEKVQLFSEIAAQVAHDIRSPLSVLKSYTKDLPGIPVDQSQAIQLSVNRIGDILTDLERGKKSHVSSEPQSTLQLPEKVLLLLAVEQIVAEKRFQYASKPEITITAQSTADVSSCISVQPKEFSRILSNLIDNSVQSIPSGRNGDIVIAIANGRIDISDTGAGISDEILPKLFEKGATFGKSEGTGLGLFHAKQMVLSWNGSIVINSRIDQGTTVSIQLPQVSPPDWLCPNLNLQQSDSILILDDDPSVHQFWEGRLKRKQIFHAYSFPQAREFLKELPDRFFVDYEIKNDPMTGFDIIRELGISQNSILITSHYNERDLQERCIQIGLKIIPKPLLAQIEITL